MEVERCQNQSILNSLLVKYFAVSKNTFRTVQNCSALLASLEALTLDWISESRAPSVLNNNNSLL